MIQERGLPRGELFRHPDTTFIKVKRDNGSTRHVPNRSTDSLAGDDHIVCVSMSIVEELYVENLSNNPTLHFDFRHLGHPSSEDDIHPSACSFQSPDTHILQF